MNSFCAGAAGHHQGVAQHLAGLVVLAAPDVELGQAVGDRGLHRDVLDLSAVAAAARAGALGVGCPRAASTRALVISGRTAFIPA